MSTVQELQRQLDAARAELQDFTYTVSHDLRAPLRHIHAFAKIMQEDLINPPPDILSHLATIRQSAQLLTNQLDGLTRFARLGAQPMQPQAVDVSALVQVLVNDLAQLHPAVTWQLAPDVPLVWGDGQALRQVLALVLDNAVKFSRSRPVPQITLSWQLAEAPELTADVLPGTSQPAQAKLCQISITDNGIGFAPEQASKLFKVFAKLHPVRDHEGLGLGLVSSRKIVERLGGNIDITAQVDAGCRVMLALSIA
ncbi:MAG: ATP-binding protein [Rhodoferax sp.]|uniref:sensor histidine kinase n=1 Tax=Rhodoferax sp. TaxID=50421 RepID=UPI00261FD98F|nr:ATP-binding protein [Rhodoferax sp.]MDD2880854.1 ATP-binding protein [Rhodoferax sp.]